MSNGNDDSLPYAYLLRRQKELQAELVRLDQQLGVTLAQAAPGACELCARDPGATETQVDGVTMWTDARKCAFIDGVFNTVNWRCATLGELRDAFEDQTLWGLDEHWVLCVAIDEHRGPQPGEYTTPFVLVMTGYKSRGRVQDAFVLEDGERQPLTGHRAALALADAMTPQLLSDVRAAPALRVRPDFYDIAETGAGEDE